MNTHSVETESAFDIRTSVGSTVIRYRGDKPARSLVFSLAGESGRRHLEDVLPIRILEPITVGRVEVTGPHEVTAHWSVGHHPLVAMTVGWPRAERMVEALLTPRRHA